MNKRTTIILSSFRSSSRLANAIKHLNDTIYQSDMFTEDRIKFEPIMNSKTGDLEHFEVTGTPLDFFQIGLRYGASEEREYLQPYMMDFYKDIVAQDLVGPKTLETNPL